MISDYSEQIHKTAMENCYNKPTQPKKHISYIAVFPDLVSGETRLFLFMLDVKSRLFGCADLQNKKGVGISPPS